MRRVTIHLNDNIEKKMNAAAQSSQLSVGEWIAQLIKEQVDNEWPASVIQMAGSWDDFPTLEEIRD